MAVAVFNKLSIHLETTAVSQCSQQTYRESYTGLVYMTVRGVLCGNDSKRLLQLGPTSAMSVWMCVSMTNALVCDKTQFCESNLNGLQTARIILAPLTCNIYAM